MDLIQHVRVVENQDPAQGFITPVDLNTVFVDHLRKQASRTEVDKVRSRLLMAARRLRENTSRLNKLLNDPQMMIKLEQLHQKHRAKGYWASHLLSLPLLDSAIHQLEQAKTVHDALLAMARLVGIVEDQPQAVETPYVPRVKYGSDRYHQVYKYLMQAAGWPPEAVKDMDETLALFSDQLLASLAQKVRNGARLNKQPRPKGW